MEQDLERCVVRILNQYDATIGTGFVVADGLAVTCAHVVKAAGRMCDECDRHESRKSNGENAPTRGREATTKCSASPAGMPRTGPLAGACYSGIFLAACRG